MCFLGPCVGADQNALQTIDITVGPAVDGYALSSSQPAISPPQYSSASSSLKPPAPSCAPTSLKRRPSLPPGTRPYNFLPTQLQREFSPPPEIEPEMDDELYMAQNQLVSPLNHTCILRLLTDNRNGKC